MLHQSKSLDLNIALIHMNITAAIEHAAVSTGMQRPKRNTEHDCVDSGYCCCNDDACVKIIVQFFYSTLCLFGRARNGQPTECLTSSLYFTSLLLAVCLLHCVKDSETESVSTIEREWEEEREKKMNRDAKTENAIKCALIVHTILRLRSSHFMRHTQLRISHI